jgi:hypothetical protein
MERLNRTYTAAFFEMLQSLNRFLIDLSWGANSRGSFGCESDGSAEIRTSTNPYRTL